MAGTTRQAKEIFLDALEITDQQQRQASIAKACGNNADLLAEVQELLQHHHALGDFFATGPVPLTTAQDADATETAGTIIGPYKLLQKIGEGGMGIVFMAEQTKPVQRKVALKVIKPGMDSKQVIARFEAERQALALMDHVNIARVFDGGTTESGRPYFVMELVHGVPITKYCDDNHLTPRERLELFIPVCQAIQHAHQKGIIHRDLKPSNVLVTLYDGKPVPKVIDFGVAKATEQKLTERTMFTNFGMMVGTLEYMSPEQAEMSALGVDTRSDIYSLGVLLYELLTGSTPISRQQMKVAAYAEILRLIKDEEPPRPSTRLSTSGAALTTISALRKMQPDKLAKLVRGELDWIVMKTLEKDRNRRYETPSALARDIERFLADDAVEACPPSMLYRMRKMCRRNRGKVIAASIIFLSLVGGIIGTTWGLFAADAARQEAVQNGAETTAVLKFLEEQFLSSARDPDRFGGMGRDVKLLDVLKKSLTVLDKSFADQPLIEARLRMTLGKALSGLGGDAEKHSVEQFERARAIYTNHRGPNDPDTLESMLRLTTGYAGLGKSAEALHVGQETLERRKATLGPTHRDTLRSSNNVVVALASADKLDEARQLGEETLPIWRAHFGTTDTGTLVCMQNLANIYIRLGRYEDALKLDQENLVAWKALFGPNEPGTIGRMNSVANDLSHVGRYQEALNLTQETLKLAKDVLGLTNDETLRSMDGLGHIHQFLGQHEDALKIREEMVPIVRKKNQPDDYHIFACVLNLGCSHALLGHFDQAQKLFEEAASVGNSTSATNRICIKALENLALLLADAADPKFRNPQRALELAKRAVTLVPKNPSSWAAMGVACYRTSDWQGTINAYEKCVQLSSKDMDSSDWFFLAMAHWHLGQQQEARKWYDKAVQWMEKNKPQDKELIRYRAEAAELMKEKETSTTRK
jgi:serine/threonine protein kinase/tetratricopeptide (TPR) repeat protein